MYNEKYEILCCVTSYIITTTSIIIFINTENVIIIFIIISGTISLLTRLYRLYKEEYVMNHPLVYADIIFAIIAFCTFIVYPFDQIIYYPIVISFSLMIIAAIMSWNIFPIHLIKESFYFQSTGHIIISFTLCYYIFFIE